MESFEGRGVVRSCSKCKKPIASQIKIYGWGSWHTFCRNPECNSDEVITISYKSVVTIASAVSIVLISLFIKFDKTKASKYIPCDSFNTQEAAQALFDTDRSKYKYLDKDGDLLACEDLIGKNVYIQR